jgi:CheY-like chemotaxis protein
MPRVLLAEDELLIAMDTQSMLEQCHCTVLGPAASVEMALSLIRSDPPDAAVLDVNLAEERVWPVAKCLQEQGIPFALVTGYGLAEVPECFRQGPVLSKPTNLDDLGRALEAMGVLG